MTKTKKKNKDHPGVYGALPRVGLPDHEWLWLWPWLRRRVQGRIQGLYPVPASAAVKRVHRLDLADRLPPRIRTAPDDNDPRRARRPAPNHIHVFFPRCLRRCQLEATELSVPIPSSLFFFHLLGQSPTFAFVKIK